MRFRAWIALLLAFLLGGCGMIGGATPTPLPTVVLEEPAAGSPPGEPAAAVTTQPESAAQAPTAVTDGAAPSADDFGGSVAASAEIVPAQTADLTFSAPAQVQGLVVTEGDFVRAGEVLASQDNMKQLQSALETSQKALTAAQLDYDQLLSNVPVERANAQLALIKAQKALDYATKASRNKEFQRASQETIDVARARLIVANQALDNAENEFDTVNSRGTEDEVFAAGLSMVAKARQEQVLAQYNLNYVLGLPSPLDIEEAEANVSLAQANLLAAKDAWEKVKDGDPNETAAAGILARIAEAQYGLDTAQLAIDRATLRAPFDGTVITVEVSPGQVVNPGEPILTLADLNNLQVETTDLSERDINRVEIGQPVNVTIEGLNQTITGEVIKIDPRATKVGGDVVYKVTIRLDEKPAGLRWGMSATVQIGP